VQALSLSVGVPAARGLQEWLTAGVGLPMQLAWRHSQAGHLGMAYQLVLLFACVAEMASSYRLLWLH
jgi:hypothetical protein